MTKGTPVPDIMGTRDIDRVYRARAELLQIEADELSPELEDEIDRLQDELGQLLADVGVETYFPDEESTQD